MKILKKIFKKKQSSSEAKEIEINNIQEIMGIKAEYEKQKSEILSEAYRVSESIKGEGDAEATAIYSGSYGKDLDFYTFYKTINKWNGKLNCQNQEEIMGFLFENKEK
jgi:modulator of FtsH protease HflC